MGLAAGRYRIAQRAKQQMPVGMMLELVSLKWDTVLNMQAVESQQHTGVAPFWLGWRDGMSVSFDFDAV